MSDSIKWLFFDVGGTIFDDEPVYQFQEDTIFGLLNEHGCEVSGKEFAAAVRAARRYYLPNYVHHLIWIFTESPGLYERIALQYERQMNRTPAGEFKALIRPIPGMKDLLLDAAQRYRLGIIGNQPAIVRQRLEEEGLVRIFKVQALSAEMGLRKPDLRFFLGAMALAGCAANEAVMVGDRLDNDVFPARNLGMTTVRLKMGPHRHQPVLSPEYLPHHTVSSVNRLSKLLLSGDLVPAAPCAGMIW